MSDPATPLAEYRDGDFFLATSARTLLGQGCVRALSGSDSGTLVELVGAALADHPSAVAVGILPFELSPGARHTGHLVVPRRCLTGGPVHGTAFSAPGVTPRSVVSVPQPQGHADAVANAVRRIRDGALRKVVLARAVDLRFADEVDPAPVLRTLAGTHPDGFTFAANLPSKDGVGRTLIGSTPELLLSRKGNRVVSRPHAGSAPRSADPETDRANGAALRASAKDRAEHALVVDAVAETLGRFCRRLEVPPEPVLTATPTVWQLASTITGELADPSATSLRLAAALHPTPAVCGTPTDRAREVVAELEPFDRGYYAGAVGWTDASGDGEWAVTVRCGEFAGDTVRLYAGGGIVRDSDPQAELDETTVKFRPLLRAMGLPESVLDGG